METKRVQELYEVFKKATGVSTDTRSLQKGELFFALKGDNFDGNLYASQALAKGALLAVVDDPALRDKSQHFWVPNALKALQALARFHRDQLTFPVLGITGSNGKTTTKELIAAVLSKKFKLWFTQGNLNNHIGLPLTLLRSPKDTELLILEMGANKVGDIQELCEMGQPSLGLITNLGKAHLEGFGGFEGVIRGKSELYQHLIQVKGQVFINRHQDILMKMAHRFTVPPIYYGGPEDMFFASLVDSHPFLSYQTEQGKQMETHLSGAYNLDNIAAAGTIGRYFEVPEKLIHSAIAEYIPSNNRSQVIEKGTCKIVADAYNANPDSMEKALEALQSSPAKYKAVILGDMLELGVDAKREHEKIAERLKEMNLAKIILFGKHMKELVKLIPEAQHFSDKDSLHQYLANEKWEGARVLVKGSRGMCLESVYDHIQG